MAVQIISPDLGIVFEGEKFSFKLNLFSDLFEPIMVTKIREMSTNQNASLIYTLGGSPRISGWYDNVFDQDQITTYSQSNDFVNKYETVGSFNKLPADAMRIVNYRIDPRREITSTFEIECLEGDYPQIQKVQARIIVRNNYSYKAYVFQNKLKELEG